jgi:hypothetical protein
MLARISIAACYAIQWVTVTHNASAWSPVLQADLWVYGCALQVALAALTLQPTPAAGCLTSCGVSWCGCLMMCLALLDWKRHSERTPAVSRWVEGRRCE